MAAPQALSVRLRASDALMTAGVVALVVLAPPATAASVGLTAILALLTARLDLPRALALSWGLALVPVYLDFEAIAFPAQPIIAAILFTRIFVLERRRITLPGRAEWVLLGVVLVAGVVSTGLSDEPVVAAYYLARLLIFLLYIPAALAVYTDWRTISPSLTALLVGLMIQSVLGIAQFVLGIDFSLGVLQSPVTPAFILRPALEGKLFTQDYNWIWSGYALPSGLFLNSIVYAVCLATGAMVLLGAPARWFPEGRAGIWRAGGIISVVVAFGCFKLTAWLGILAGGAAFVLLRIPDRRTRWRALVLPPLALTIVGFLFWDAIQQRLLDIARGSLFTRLLTWFSYARNLQHRGIVGVGLGRASLLAPQLSTVAGGQSTSLELAPESAPIGLAAEIGIPGMLALFTLIILPALRKRPQAPTWCWPALAAVLVGNLAVYGLPEDHVMPLVALLVGLAASRGGHGE